MKRITAIVHGRVQGVGFRYSTQREAQRLGVTGYVRNQPDDTVEIVAEGTAAQLEALIAWAHQGPPNAQVTQVAVTESVAQNTFDQFTIER